MRKKQPRKICSAAGCDRPSRSKGYCPRHYKQFLRHGRLTPDKEHRDGCMIKGCKNRHKARGYCAKHYKELMIRGEIKVSVKIKHPLCSVSNCAKTPTRRGLCEEHYKHYCDDHVKNGETWDHVDKLIVLHNQDVLFKRNRLILIKERHRALLNKQSEEQKQEILKDIFSDGDPEYIGYNEAEEGIQDVHKYLSESLWSEAEEHESRHLWEEKLQNLR